MDTASRNRGRSRKGTPARRPARPPQEAGDRDSRRLIQLLVSAALFLLVYLGRGVLPGQVEAWRNALTSSVDFQGAFQQFGQAVSEGEPVRDALQDLCVTVFGGQPEEKEEPELAAPPFHAQLLGASPSAGLDWLREHGALADLSGPGGGEAVPSDLPASDPPAQPSEPEPAATPAGAAVTAVAYDDQGRALPSKVSFVRYDLGLDRTVNPVEGKITSRFGYRDSPIDGDNEFHLALDIGAAEGTEIGAFADGTVRYIGESDEFGKYLCIDHANHVATFYAHCSKLLVSKGQQVSCGETVALVGHTGNATGPHLHLTILKDDIRLDPIYYVDL